MSQQSGGDRSLIAKQAGCHSSDNLLDRRGQSVGAIERGRTSTEALKRRIEAEHPVRSLDAIARALIEKGVPQDVAYRQAMDELETKR